MRGGIVKKDSMCILVVLTKTFAVIADDYDQRILIPSLLLKIGYEVGEG